MVVDEFVHSRGGAASSGLRVWRRLCWLHRHLRAPFVIEEAMRPVLERSPEDAGEPVQATVIEPGMVVYLDRLAAAFARRGGWQAVPIAAAQALCFGWLRFQHMSRSFPTERTRHVAWFRCYRGKRSGPFDWCLPRDAGAACAADLLWDAWHRVADAHSAKDLAPPRG